MKSNTQKIAPLPVATTGSFTSPPLDVGAGFSGFVVQTIGVSGSSGTYTVEGSLDGGTTWKDITSSLKDFGAADAAVTPPIATDSIFEFPVRFPGLVRLRCTHAATGAPAAYLSFQDSRQE